MANFWAVKYSWTPKDVLRESKGYPRVLEFILPATLTTRLKDNLKDPKTKGYARVLEFILPATPITGLKDKLKDPKTEGYARVLEFILPITPITDKDRQDNKLRQMSLPATCPGGW